MESGQMTSTMSGLRTYLRDRERQQRDLAGRVSSPSDAAFHTDPARHYARLVQEVGGTTSRHIVVGERD